MNDRHDDDQAFTAYLRGESALSSWYQQTRDLQPPSTLDAALLAAANDTMHPPRPRRGWRRRWAVPLSAAAVLILSVTLAVWQRGVDSPLPVSPPQRAILDDRNPKQEPTALAPEPQIPLATQPRMEVDAPKKAELRAQPPAPGASIPSPLAEPRASEAMSASGRTSAGPRATPQAESLATNKERGRQDADEAQQQSVEERLTPDAWLRQIDTLRQQGNIAAAEASLAAFKRRYPHYLLNTREKEEGEKVQGK